MKLLSGCFCGKRLHDSVSSYDLTNVEWQARRLHSELAEVRNTGEPLPYRIKEDGDIGTTRIKQISATSLWQRLTQPGIEKRREIEAQNFSKVYARWLLNREAEDVMAQFDRIIDG